MKNLIAVLLVLSLLAVLPCAALAEGAEALSETERRALEHLEESTSRAAEKLLIPNETGIREIYTDLHCQSASDSFPARFDLRSRGVVTPVKDQSPWGTCWSFGAVAASESSILSDLHLTAEEYAGQYGDAMDLSEKHLTWFTLNALPVESETDVLSAGQSGEGLYILDGVDESCYALGGEYLMAASSLAAGVGPAAESVAPYESSTGTLSMEDDWSLPEGLRCEAGFELTDANRLPSPAGRDEDGNYVYHPEGTEAIKSELLKGRAVAIAFYADQSLPSTMPDQLRAMLEQSLSEIPGESEEDKAFYIDARTGVIPPEELTDEQLCDLIRFRCRINELEEDLYDLSALSRDELFAVFSSSYFSLPVEELFEAENMTHYLSYLDTDPMIAVQYTDDCVYPNHGVCIIGWDDSFSAMSFPEGHRPPGDGVWIVKNSWGENWGMDGYFYLSYYDKNLYEPFTFAYDTSLDPRKPDRTEILQYDRIPLFDICSTLFDAPVYSGNIFRVPEDCVLQYVTALTGDLDTRTTVSVYLLDEDAANPTDGILIQSVTQDFPFAGYHRIELPQNLALDEGARIGVVTLNRVTKDSGVRYALADGLTCSREGAIAYNEQVEKEVMLEFRYALGVVNRGESFVSFEAGRWIDWRDVLDGFSGGFADQLVFDNLPIKAGICPLDGIMEKHRFDNWVRTAGADAGVCADCGYTLLFTAPGARGRLSELCKPQ